MADIIQLLPDHVANQIAAGEVVQRPASVVKELLENAVDAGATTIRLNVKDGGRTLIQVIDNGRGMSDTDTRMSFERHATSKINSAQDLFNLKTKGFRGEALASIAAIAHVEMHSREQGAELGTQIRIEGGKLVSQEVTAVAEGTSVAVKNLFFNIPARRNFLKSDQVELRHITDEFQRVALAHPQIGFEYYHNGSALFNLAPAELRKRIVQVFGRKTNEKLVPLNEGTPNLEISGFICKPQFAKKSRGEQFFFVNDRFIKSSYLNHAVISAFEGLIKPEAYPGYFIYLTLDPGSIDINIHPTKTEIKFDDEHTIYAILRSAIKHSLGQFSVAPVLDFERDSNLDTPYDYRNKGADLPQVSVDRMYNPFKEGAGQMGAKFSGKAEPASWEALYTEIEPAADLEAGFSTLKLESEMITGKIFEESEQDRGVTTLQLGRKYILTTIKSGVLLIDQARAHQRVLYEKFLKNLTMKETVSQQLLFPLALSFSRPEMVVLSEMQESLQDLGFAFEEFGQEQLKLSGIPNMIGEAQIGVVLDGLIANYQDELAEEGFSQADFLAKSLCATLAVRSGESLNTASQVGLVNDLFACKESGLSPFNKTIFITISEHDIDKKFS